MNTSSTNANENRRDDLLLQGRILQASIIDSLLVTLIAVWAWLSLALSTIFIQVACLRWPGPYSVVLIWLGPVVAPALYRATLSYLDQNATIGEKWLGIDIGRCLDSFGFRQNWKGDLLTGCAISFLVCALYCVYQIPDVVIDPNSNYFSQHPFSPCPPTVFAAGYSVILAFVLRVLKGREISKNPQSFHLLPIALDSKWLMLTRFWTYGPIAVFVFTWFIQDKSVWSPLDSASGRIHLTEDLFWLLWTRPIIVFSRSKLFSALYFFVLVCPFLMTAVLMPFILNHRNPGLYDMGPCMSGSK